MQQLTSRLVPAEVPAYRYYCLAINKVNVTVQATPGVVHNLVISNPGDGAGMIALHDDDPIDCTQDATLDVIQKTQHGLQLNDRVQFETALGGIQALVTYWVIAPGADTFGISLTEGGDAVTITASGSNQYYSSRRVAVLRVPANARTMNELNAQFAKRINISTIDSGAGVRGALGWR